MNDEKIINEIKSFMKSNRITMVQIKGKKVISPSCLSEGYDWEINIIREESDGWEKI